MQQLLFLIPGLPLLGFLILALVGRRMSKPMIAFTGAGSVILAAVLVIILGLQFLGSPPAGNAYVQTLWQWLNIAGLSVSFTLKVDSLTLVFLFVITFV